MQKVKGRCAFGLTGAEQESALDAASSGPSGGTDILSKPLAMGISLIAAVFPAITCGVFRKDIGASSRETSRGSGVPPE
jgi:hypothetical protein